MRFSGRLPGAFEPNRIHRAVEAKRRAGARLLDLTETNPTRAGLPVADAWGGLVEGARAPYEPSAAGAAAVRQAIGRYYAERGLGVSADRIVLTASTSEAYAHLFRLLADPGDEILVPEPSYPLFAPLAALESVELAPYALRYEGSRWRVDLDTLRANSRTRAVIVVHPNNPTGSLLAADEVEAVESLGLPIVSDEVFGDFAFPAAPRHPSFAASDRGLAFTLAGLSKTCGLPQAKLAWIVCSGAASEVARAREGLDWIGDAFLSVAPGMQAAAPGLLAARAPFLAATRARLTAHVAALAAVGLDRLAWEGGWSAVIRAPASRTDEEWTLAALERDVLVQPGHFYDFADERHLVVSLLAEPGVFAEGARRLGELLV